jgi:hypothetical protein
MRVQNWDRTKYINVRTSWNQLRLKFSFLIRNQNSGQNILPAIKLYLKICFTFKLSRKWRLFKNDYD